MEGFYKKIELCMEEENMVHLDEIDMKILKENFDEDMIQQMDEENIDKILYYLE